MPKRGFLSPARPAQGDPRRAGTAGAAGGATAAVEARHDAQARAAETVNVPPDYTGLCKLLYDWQTLIAGGLALFAGVVTVCGTLRSAKRQVKATNDAADRQITAAQEQTAAAQHQTAVMRDMERRRISREGYAFYAMLEAAMGAVIEDVGVARKLPPGDAPTQNSAEAYAVRHRVKRAGFAELRSAFLRFGGADTAKFLKLDKEIEDFAGQWTPRSDASGVTAAHRLQSRAFRSAQSYRAASKGVTA